MDPAPRADLIRVRGARTHNLYSVSLDIPRGQLVVFTGPSGSGKSSLVFDTIFAEGQRRFLATLPSLPDHLKPRRPPVDSINGLPPVLSVAQDAGVPRPRSTLATLTEIHDHLRLLWARRGTPYCPDCQLPVTRQTITEISRYVTSLPAGTKLYLLAPLVAGAAGPHDDLIASMRKTGFLRLRVDGVLREITGSLELDESPHTIDLVVDRLVVREGIIDRLMESLASCARHGDGRVIVSTESDGWHDVPFSTKLACPRCRRTLPELEPRRFHFNTPHGACPRCTGLGLIEAGDDEMAICPECAGTRLNRDARAVRYEGITRRPLSPGTPGEREGVRGSASHAETGEVIARDAVPLTPNPSPPEDRGRGEPRGMTLTDVCALPVADALAVFRNATIDPATPFADVETTLVREITTRLFFLDDVGLGYLTLDRPAPTLSGGELQRARLATQLGGGLRGVAFILDEPTAGLHPRDTERLLAALRGLKERGNSLLVVEHDEAVMRAADMLVDLGPGAGPHGGRILAAGTVDEVCQNPQSVTAPFLCGTRATGGLSARASLATTESLPPDPGHSSRAGRTGGQAARGTVPSDSLVIKNARHHNLRGIDVTIPLGRLVAVTGVSGSGKSSLVHDILARAVRQHLKLTTQPPGLHDAVLGLEHIDKLIEADQKPIGRSSRSNAATYTGLFDEIRKLFARTRTAKIRGYSASRFSANARGGRCETCQGHGELRAAGPFLPELTVPCPACQGRRFNPGTLEVRFKGQSIADVLAMPVARARDFFQAVPPIARILAALDDVGLGYLPLGQPATRLSGGEAQRVKLAAELAREATGRTLVILDEPTSGLHRIDIARLLTVLGRLTDAGNTVVVIEHHLSVIEAADWIIDLGPGAGEAGGALVAAGPPAVIAQNPQSLTGAFLRECIVTREMRGGTP